MIRRRGKSPRPVHKATTTNPVAISNSLVGGKRPKILIKGEPWPVVIVAEGKR